MPSVGGKKVKNIIMCNKKKLIIIASNINNNY